jgi:hypothetical protein
LVLIVLQQIWREREEKKLQVSTERETRGGEHCEGGMRQYRMCSFVLFIGYTKPPQNNPLAKSKTKWTANVDGKESKREEDWEGGGNTTFIESRN